MALALGTNGVRGLFNELTPQAANDFGFAFAKWAATQAPAGPGAKKRIKIALGRDMRITSPCISQSVAAGIMEAGADVLDLGIVTSPLAEWANEHFECDGLVIVTASHNPAQYNALKFVDRNGIAISRERGEKFNEFVGKKHEPALEWQKIGKLEACPDVIEEYKKAVLVFVDDKKIAKKANYKIVADVGNGTATLVAPDLLRRLGAEVIVLNEKLDGTFPSRPSEPTEANVQKCIEEVKKQKADFGVAWDGDADRVVFIDDKGRWLVGDKCVALATLWALEKEAHKKDEKHVITTVATSKVVEDVAAARGAKTIYTDVGAPYLAEKGFELKKTLVCGGEEVGGIIWPKFSLAKDGVLAACKLMEMVALKPLSAWHDELPKYYNAKTKVDSLPGKNVIDIAKLEKAVEAEKKGDMLKVSGGFRLNFKDSWVLARASGTENYIRIFAESTDEAKANRLMNEYKEKLLKIST